MRSDSATVLTETAHRSTNRAGRSGEGTQPAAGLAKPHGRGDPRVARSSLDPEHGRLYGVSTEPVQGLLARVTQVARFNQFRVSTSKRGGAQANSVALTNTGHCNNSSCHDFSYHLMLAGVGK